MGFVRGQSRFCSICGFIWCKIPVLYGDISTPNKTYSALRSEQSLKSDVRNVNTALGVDVPRTKPELPQAGPGWKVRSGRAGGGHPFFGHVSGDCIPQEGQESERASGAGVTAKPKKKRKKAIWKV